MRFNLNLIQLKIQFNVNLSCWGTVGHSTWGTMGHSVPETFPDVYNCQCSSGFLLHIFRCNKAQIEAEDCEGPNTCYNDNEYEAYRTG